MGKYLNTLPTGNLPAKGKAFELLKLDGVEIIDRPPTDLTAIPPKTALVCVIANGFFDADAWVYDDDELRDFTDPTDKRGKIWLSVPTYISEYAQ